MTFKEYRYLVTSDLYRIVGNMSILSFLKYFIFGETFKYNVWLRTCAYTKSHRLLLFTVYPFARFIHRHLTFKLGISIPVDATIGSGFYIGHFGGIEVHPKCVIGKNFNISQGVTLGEANRGKKKGNPMVGDNVYIGPGAKVIGAVKIGNNVAIGANCVVTKDVPDNSVVVGIPGKVISQDGSVGYVNRTDY